MPSPLTPRQRLLAAVRHQEPDRIPLDLGGMRSSGITALAYGRLRLHLGLAGGAIRVSDPLLQLAYVEDPLRQRLGCDAIPLFDETQPWQPYCLPDGTPAQIPASFAIEPDGQGGEYAYNRSWRRPPGGLYFDPVSFPLSEASCLADLDRYPWPPQPADSALERLQKLARRLYTETDYAVIGEWQAGAFLEGGQWLRGASNFLMDLAGQPAFAEALLDRLLAQQLRDTELYLQAVGDYIQIIQVNDDLGLQTGPQISPEMYYHWIQPRQQAVWRRIHQLRPGLAVMLHSCGGIYDLIPGLIAAGCDILNPVQISARGMEPARLKRAFGGQLCFWGGGCDTQQVLPFGTPEQVYAHTCQNLAIFKPGGGYVFCQVHNLQADVPVENMLAMYAALHDHWQYG